MLLDEVRGTIWLGFERVKRRVREPGPMTGGEVVIVDRTFRIEAVYARRRGWLGNSPPRRLLAYDEGSILPVGRVTIAIVPSGNRRTMTGEQWAGWAGEEVRP